MVKVLRSLVRGPLEPYVPGFAEELLRQGYSCVGAEQHVCFIAHLDRWMSSHAVGVEEPDAAVIDRYLVQRRAAGYVQYNSVKALAPLLGYLAPLDVLSIPAPAPVDPVEELLARYSVYLLGECGLTAGTARGYVDCVRGFVRTRNRGGELDWAGLDAAEVNAYVLTTCPARAVGSAKLIVTALRSLLGWLHLAGTLPASLVAAVPSVAGWRLSGLPRPLDPAELRRLLAAPDRRTATGRRDYAMLLLSRLGLRAGEVARLELDDIDWRHGELVVHGKGDRKERLPLPADVGTAITKYLQQGRPATAQGRRVFIRVHAPHRGLTTTGISQVVHDGAQHAGLGTMHAHRLRHTAATAMLRAGSPLPEVGQVLRHRSWMSTAIYAKADHDALGALVRPWPTARSAPTPAEAGEEGAS
jgi:integrase/recombinase XerD